MCVCLHVRACICMCINTFPKQLFFLHTCVVEEHSGCSISFPVLTSLALYISIVLTGGEVAASYHGFNQHLPLSNDQMPSHTLVRLHQYFVRDPTSAF